MITKEKLVELYENQEKSMKEIAKETGISVGSVYNYIKKYEIESRPKMTEKTKAKISQALKGHPSKKKGQHLSEETKKKISESHKGRYRKKTTYGGHKKKRKDGYIAVYCPGHPSASKDGHVMEHVLIMENHIGRRLRDDEVVHHKNHQRDDNRIENLQLMTFKEHSALHMRERWAERRKNGK